MLITDTQKFTIAEPGVWVAMQDQGHHEINVSSASRLGSHFGVDENWFAITLSLVFTLVVIMVVHGLD
jgi:hypothetical protein